MNQDKIDETSVKIIVPNNKIQYEKVNNIF